MAVRESGDSIIPGMGRQGVKASIRRVEGWWGDGEVGECRMTRGDDMM
jgi:hypothetical protein